MQRLDFVVDTSRNGQGPWTPPAGVYPDPQDWCNPPARGLGTRPTAATGVPGLDAYLWVKVPDESDGSCTRGTAGPAAPPARATRSGAWSTRPRGCGGRTRCTSWPCWPHPG